MKYLSLCSGIEAATVAWHPLGWEAVAYSEIEKFPSQVLAQHYPQTPNLGDMTKFKEWSIESNVDLLVGGTPCQSFSVAGLRKGLDDPRGNLMLTYLAIADKYRPRWLVWENVPGVLSSNGGQDFGVFLGALGELGYGFAYRVLDAQYFGVAQRRRRVFVVGYLGDWRAAAAVLFERHSLSGNPAPSREKGKGAAASVREGVANSSWPAEISSTLDTTFGTKQGLEDQHVNAGCPMFVPAKPTSYALQGAGHTSQNSQGSGWNEEVSFTLNRLDVHGVAQPIPLNTMTMQGRPSDDGRMGSGIGEPGDPCPTLTKAHSHAVAQPVYEMHGQDSRVRDLGDTCSTVTSKWGTGGGNVPVTTQSICLMDQGGSVMNIEHDMTGTLRRETHGHEPVVMQRMAVRRLTPVECERLQGFPDNYTDIKPKGKATPDGPRYKALGNSMAVPVMAWIGQRIEQVEAICKQNK
jgi:DNA (cytosine-5)-methyltransferase 1